MGPARWQRALLMALILILCLFRGSARGQGPDNQPAHEEIPFPRFDLMELSRRLKNAQNQALFKALMELKENPSRLLSEQEQRGLMSLLDRLALDPKDVQRIQEQLRQPTLNKNRLPPAWHKSDQELQNLLKQLLEQFQKNPGTSTGQSGTNPVLDLGRVNPEDLTDGALPSMLNDPKSNPFGLDPAELKDRQEFARWLLKQSERFKDLDNGRFGDAPALREALRNLKNISSDNGFSGWNLPRPGDGWGEKLNRMGRDLLPRDVWNRLKLPAPAKISLPNLPRLNMPKVNIPWSGMPSVGTPSLQPPPLPSSLGNQSGFLWLVVALAAGLAAWLLYRRYGPRFTGRKTDTGPVPVRWPMPLEALATRADVIRAFECLSLARLGVEVRSWNHRAIAAGLGGEHEDQRQAAGQLADLYEQARYAPGAEPLPDESLQNARRSFSFLAGVSAA